MDQLPDFGDYNLLDDEFFFFTSSPPSPPSAPSPSPLPLPSPLSPLENTEWTFEENKVFENAVAEFGLTSVDFFEKVGSMIPGKTLDEIKEHYEALVEDVEKIEMGLVPLPDYDDDSNKNDGKRSSARKKGVAWTKEEHENFLKGLKAYGKGDWKSISRNCVQTRSPTQVASHAQKHYLRLKKQHPQKTHANPSTSKPNKS